MMRAAMTLLTVFSCWNATLIARADDAGPKLAPHFTPPAEFAGQFGPYRSPLKFEDGTPVRDATDWARRRADILRKWHDVMGPWPATLDRPKLESREASSITRYLRGGPSHCGVTPKRVAMRSRTRRLPSSISGASSERIAPTR